jgi:hypothetical protein
MKAGKLILGAGILFGLWKLANAATKASALQSNIYVNPAFKSARMQGITPLVTFAVTIQNISGINLRVRNLFSKIFIVTPEGRSEIGYSNVTDEVAMPSGESSSFDTTFNISGLTTISRIFKAQQLEIVTYYEVAGQRLSYTSNMNVAEVVNGIKAKLGLKGTDEYLQYNPLTGTYQSVI